MTSEERLGKAVVEYRDDPLGLVLWLFAWGQGQLSSEDGPDDWQKDILIRIGRFCQGKYKVTLVDILRIVIRSGHGTGKTALISWVILWFMLTRPGCRIVVTASTKDQLTSKTWAELHKWFAMMPPQIQAWYEITKTGIAKKGENETWFGIAQPWSKERAQSFAGTHGKHVLYILDEGSIIADEIYDVIEGAFSDCVEGGTRIWLVFGNPSETTGRFREISDGSHRHRWYHKRIDSREVKRTDKAKIQEDIDLYGEDSDFVRVRWKGEFPRASIRQFINEDLVRQAQQKQYAANDYYHAARVVGFDIAREGDDSTSIIMRQGPVAYNLSKYRNLKTDQIYDIARALLERGLLAHGEHDPETYVDMLFLDMGNIGAAVYDLLYRHEAFRDRVTGIWFGATAEMESRYANRRVEMWDRMRTWLEYGSIPNDDDLFADLSGPMVSFDKKERYLLESKKDMKSRGLSSPDCGDALAMTFYMNIFKKEHTILETLVNNKRSTKNYDPMARGRR